MNQKQYKIITLLSGIAVCVCMFLWEGIENVIFYPTMVYAIEGDKKITFSYDYMNLLSPFYQYVNEHLAEDVVTEDSLTHQMILAQQELDEEILSEDLQTVVQNAVPNITTNVSLEQLRDFNYLISKFYTVDSTTTIGKEQLNVDDFMSRDMRINKDSKGPKVLIFHTHSQEDFTNSVPNDSNTTIVGVGRYLAELLNAKGIETYHHDGVYDLINGKLDRSKAYQMAENGVKEILNQNPSIEVVIDLHRDGVPESTHLVTNINGKQTAKIMFFNGLSRTKTNGNIASLPNPYIQDNLAFSFQMQLACQNQFPGFTRRIYLKGYRYSLHMMPKSLLIEAGAQTNSVEEVKNAMEILANVLVEVLL